MDITRHDEANYITCLLTEKLDEDDFEALGEAFKDMTKETGKTPSLLIYLQKFPGYKDGDAIEEHLEFIRDHQNKIDKIAIVAESSWVSALPRLVGVFTHPEIYHFSETQFADAEAWVSGKTALTGTAEAISGLPDDVAGFRMKGVITGKVYEQEIMPRLDAMVERHQKIKALIVLDSAVENYTMSGMWNDAKLGVTHFKHFEKIALVTNSKPIGMAIQAFSWVFPGEIRVFGIDEEAQARAWIIMNDRTKTS